MAELLFYKETKELVEVPEPLSEERRAQLQDIIDPNNKKLSVLQRGLALQQWLQANGDKALSHFDVSDHELGGAIAVWQDLCCEVNLAPQLPTPQPLCMRGLNVLTQVTSWSYVGHTRRTCCASQSCCRS